MKHYGIADIGSNTMVLIIYHFENGLPVQDHYQSTPVHLIQYVDSSRHMSAEGIRAACHVLAYYDSLCDEKHCDYKWADITEPCRITNLDELVSSLRTTGFEICPLTGEEEAYCDFLGSRISCPDVHSGAAFDVGGGSTELITFENDISLAAASFPLGCVRLSALPLDTGECRRMILETRDTFPLLKKECSFMIGIGGTARNCGMILDYLAHTGKTFTTMQLKDLYDRLLCNEQTAVDAMKAVVNPARQPVLLPGMHMILEILDVYKAETVILSETGIREGFLTAKIAGRHFALS